MKKLCSRSISAFVAVVSILTVAMTSFNVSASPGYLDPVVVRDSDPMGTYVINVTLEGMAQYQGKPDAAPVGYCIFRAFKVAIAEVWDGEAPLREDIIVNTTNPTKGAADAVEFITKARSRRELTLKRIPGTTGVVMTPDNWIWVFTSKSTGNAIEIKVRTDAFPVVNGKTNLEHRAIVIGKLKVGETPTAEELEDHKAAMMELKKRFKTWSDSELFETRVLTWVEPEFDPEAFMDYYAPALKPEWGRLLTVESAYDSVVETNMELQALNDELTTDYESLAAQLSETEMHRYILLATTAIFVFAAVYFAMKKAS
ncbi:MAG: hypothetical protein NWE76_05470 [Candidatus Bathyarchaeota archaeon]|nr:hypothetical protein [Candidatus Bathyarchaeota archaeon]